ncbi:NUDIX hydrolase [Parabacteroides sp.]
METHMDNKEMLYPHVSVDCVLLGVKEDKLCVLLVERNNNNGEGSEDKHYKLPGSLIYESEDLDTAAYRVLHETTGLKRVPLKQFRSFGSPDRTRNEEDVKWLENASKLKIGRIVTVAYLALSKIGRRTNPTSRYNSLSWFPIDALPYLPFDHKEIIDAAVEEIREWVEKDPSIVFDYLPAKFTTFQLRRTYEIIYNKELDVRNFQKKMLSLDYVVQTEETEKGVAHRAARYYRFDKVKYNKQRSGFNKN